MHGMNSSMHGYSCYPQKGSWLRRLLRIAVWWVSFVVGTLLILPVLTRYSSRQQQADICTCIPVLRCNNVCWSIYGVVLYIYIRARQ